MLNGFSVNPKKALYIIGQKELLRRRGRLLFIAPVPLFGRLDAGLDRADQDMSVATLQAWDAFDCAVGREISRKSHQELLSKVGVRDFSPAKLDDRLDAIAFGKKTQGVLHFEVVVVVVGVGPEFQFLHLDD